MGASLRGIRSGASIALTMVTALAAAASAFEPPSTPARPVVDVVHGVKLTDPYRWLESGRDPGVEAWSRAQHAATLRYLDAAAAPVPGLHEELVACIDRDVTRPPFFKKGRELFFRTRKGKE